MPEATRNVGRESDCGRVRRVLGRHLGSRFPPTRCLHFRAGANTEAGLPLPARGGLQQARPPAGGPAAQSSRRPDAGLGKGGRRGAGGRTPPSLTGPLLHPLARFTAAGVQPGPAPQQAGGEPEMPPAHGGSGHSKAGPPARVPGGDGPWLRGPREKHQQDTE